MRQLVRKMIIMKMMGCEFISHINLIICNVLCNVDTFIYIYNIITCPTHLMSNMSSAGSGLYIGLVDKATPKVRTQQVANIIVSLNERCSMHSS